MLTLSTSIKHVTRWRVAQTDPWAGERGWRIVDEMHRVIATCSHQDDADEIVHHHNARLKAKGEWLQGEM